MTSWHEFHQYELENGGMDDHDDGKRSPDGLTDEARALIARMIADGWHVRYRADHLLKEWEFNKLCEGKPGCGQFWRVGLDADIFKAAEAARKAESGHGET